MKRSAGGYFFSFFRVFFCSRVTSYTHCFFHIIERTISILDGLEHRRLVALGPLDDLAGRGVGGGDSLALPVQLHQLGKVESRLLEDLHLPHVNVVQGVDALASLLDVHRHGVRDQLVDDVLQVGGGHLAGHDVDHLLADLADLKNEGGEAR